MVEHKEQHKKDIRFFNEREVRPVWYEEQNSWWFSATDIVITSLTIQKRVLLVTVGKEVETRRC